MNQATQANQPSPSELALINALAAIVNETMAYPLVRPFSSESYLPDTLVDAAQNALRAYGMNIPANPAMQVGA